MYKMYACTFVGCSTHPDDDDRKGDRNMLVIKHCVVYICWFYYVSLNTYPSIYVLVSKVVLSVPSGYCFLFL
jgi:hypothetical protein